MQVTDLIVEVRDSSLARVGQILPTDLVGFTAVLRFCKVGTWEIPLHATNAMADALRAPGAGIIVTGPNGVLFSGPTTGATKSQTQENPLGEWLIKGVTDEVVLGERLAYPTPSTADVAAQVDAYDTRTGVASTIMLGYVNANIGPSAPTARKIAALSLAADPAVGSTITGNARFQTLGGLLTSLATIDGLGFGIKQVASALQFSVFQPTDRSAYIRMDVDNNMLSKSEYTYQAPEATRVIVAGQGDGADRTLLERSSTTSTTAETAWGRRIEVFKDSRNTSVTAELQQAGDEILTDKGKTLEAISVSPSDDTTMAYGVDWDLGDKVSVVAGTTTIALIVTEVGIKISDDGVRIGATVGEPAVADDESTVAEVQQDQEARITNLETNTASGGSTGLEGSVPTGSIMMWFTSTAPTGWQLCDGSTSSTDALVALIGSNVPDLRTRVPVGKAASGTFATLGSTGGAETVTLTTAQMPSHTHVQNSHNHTQNAHGHSVTDPGHNHDTNTIGDAGSALSGTTNNYRFTGTPSTLSTSTDVTGISVQATTATNVATTATNQNTGGDEAHNNLQPYIVMNYIIKA